MHSYRLKQALTLAVLGVGGRVPNELMRQRLRALAHTEEVLLHHAGVVPPQRLDQLRDVEDDGGGRVRAQQSNRALYQQRVEVVCAVRGKALGVRVRLCNREMCKVILVCAIWCV